MRAVCLLYTSVVRKSRSPCRLAPRADPEQTAHCECWLPLRGTRLCVRSPPALGAACPQPQLDPVLPGSQRSAEELTEQPKPALGRSSRGRRKKGAQTQDPGGNPSPGSGTCQLGGCSRSWACKRGCWSLAHLRSTPLKGDNIRELQCSPKSLCDCLELVPVYQVDERRFFLGKLPRGLKSSRRLWCVALCRV